MVKERIILTAPCLPAGRNLFAGFLILLLSYSAVAEIPQYVPGQLIVKFRSPVVSGPRPGVSASAAEIKFNSSSVGELFKEHRVRSIKRVFPDLPKAARPAPNLSQVYNLDLPEGTDVIALAGKFAKDPSVEYAEPNYLRYVSSPNDPAYTDYPGNPNQWGLFKVKLGSAESNDSGWKVTKGTSEVAIAVIDTGVDWDHPDLSSNIWLNTDDTINGSDSDGNGYIDDYRGWDFVDINTAAYILAGFTLITGEDYTVRDNDPIDFNGHGTHCSGIASAVTDNGTGIAGAGWNCKIMPVRSGFSIKYGGSTYGILEEDDSASAITYAASMGARVLSLSFGSDVSSDLERDAINYALSLDCVVVAAAGNSNSESVHYPAGYSGVFGVAATDVNDAKASYSNYGSWVDITAPGGGAPNPTGLIYSTYFNDTYAWMAGTSMACPLVAGISGLVRSRYPSLSNTETTQRIMYRADNIDAQNPSYIGKLGSGRINAYKAVSEADPPTVEVISPNGGESLKGGDTANITFTATDESGIKPNSLSISYSTNGGNTFPNTIVSGAPVTSPYAWTVPSNIYSTSVKIRVAVKDIFENEGSDISNGNFTIVSSMPVVSVIYPTGGELITAESMMNISYTATAEFGLAQNPISIFYSAGGAYSLITADAAYVGGTGVYAWKAPLTASSSSKIKVTARDINGLLGTAESPAFTIFLTDIQKDSLSPLISLKTIDSSGSAEPVKSGDYIKKRPSFKASIRDNIAVDQFSIRFCIDNAAVAPVLTGVSSKEYLANYTSSTDLEDEKIMTHSVRIEAKDIAGNLSSLEVDGLKVSLSGAKISGPVLSYPTVFSPAKGITSMLAYNLTADTDITVIVFGVGGEMVWTGKYVAGDMGGRAGYNQVLFKGVSDISKGFLGNGLYTIKLVSGGALLGSGKVIISD